eukprot:snap_masked-scaffold_4-processed-gene-13.13-mRNA-1 protein AED:0.24 eAED:0.24 QI:0/-1/0/1/-1/1/1/0/443
MNSNYVKAEYIWIGGHGELRSKTKIIHGKSTVKLSDLPKWNYDGSSTDQAPGEDSEVIIVPRAIFHDPFRGGNSVLVVTDTYTPKMEPLPTNSRNLANKIFESKTEDEPWFGIEQEYTLFKDGRPLGWPKSKARSIGGKPTEQIGYPAPQGPYYCSAGAGVSFGREVAEEHLLLCMKAGLTLSGINAEVMPGQWEFQVGPCTGITSGDMMTCSRYILNRVGEKYGIGISLHPKPVSGDWNGAGCHTNFSTKAMREEEDALNKHIIPAIEALGKRHAQHIHSYGAGNDERLTGKHETGDIGTFKYGVADRGASIRIPNSTQEEGKGYFEDRRPASNMDPYVVTSMIFDSSILEGKYSSEFAAIKTEGVDVNQGEIIHTNIEEQVKVAEEVKEAEAEKEVTELDKQEKVAEAVEEKKEPTKIPKATKPEPKKKAKKKKKKGCVAQ